MRGRLLRLLGVLGLAGGIALAAPAGASAHDSLAESSPAPDSTVAAVNEIRLTFSDVLLELGENQRSTALQVRRGDRYFETGCPAVSGRSISAPVMLGAEGTYEVVWQVVSSDGHPTSGTYSFTYEPAEGIPPAEGSTAPACSDAASAGGSSDDVALLGAAAGVVALAAAGVVVAVLVARRRGAKRGESVPSAPRE